MSSPLRGGTVLFGLATGGAIHRYAQAQTEDAGVPVLLRAASAIFAPVPFGQEALYRTATLVVDANVGVELELTVVLEGRWLNGTLGQPDTRVTLTLPTPAAGERTRIRRAIGLYLPVVVDGDKGRVGARGAWLQLVAESTDAVTVPLGETNPDLRLEITEVEWEPCEGRQSVVNA